MSFMERVMAAFDGNKFGNALIASQISAKINEWLEELGPERIDFLMTKNEPIYRVLTPEQIREYRKQITENATLILSVLSTHLDYILTHLPDWAVALREKHGQKGDDWLRTQLEWIEGIATGKPKIKVTARWGETPPGA
jgi:hypothetical protein